MPDHVVLQGQRSGIVCPEWAEREELALCYGDILRRLARDEDDGDGDRLHPQLLRVYSAAVGLGVPRISRAAKAADERVDYLRCGCMPLEYGGRVYGYLRGIGVPAVEIAEAGLRVLEAVGEKIAPRRKEVEEAANFTGADAAPPPASP